MYRAYFNLEENPFTTSPDPRFFYLAPSHSESVAKCEYAIRNKSGLAVVYGDVGTGETTILNKASSSSFFTHSKLANSSLEPLGNLSRPYHRTVLLLPRPTVS